MMLHPFMQPHPQGHPWLGPGTGCKMCKILAYLIFPLGIMERQHLCIMGFVPNIEIYSFLHYLCFSTKKSDIVYT